MLSSDRPGATASPDLQRAVPEARPDHDPIALVPKGVLLFLAAAQAPVALVVLEDEGNRIGNPGAHVQVPEELFARDDSVERQRVRDDVQRMVRVREEAPAVQGLEVGLVAGPLLRHEPAPALGPRGVFVDRHRDLGREGVERGVELVRDDAARKPPEALDHLLHRGVFRKVDVEDRLADARVFRLHGVARRSPRREPRVAAQLRAGEREELPAIHADHLARTERRGAGHAERRRLLFQAPGVGVAVVREDPHAVDPALLALDASFANRSREELLVAEGSPRHLLDVVAKGHLLQARAEGADLSTGVHQPRRNAAGTEAGPRNVLEEPRREGADSDDRVDGVPRPDRAVLPPHEVEELGERAPGTLARRRALDVEGLAAAEGEAVGGNQDRPRRADALAKRLQEQPAGVLRGLRALEPLDQTADMEEDGVPLRDPDGPDGGDDLSPRHSTGFLVHALSSSSASRSPIVT